MSNGPDYTSAILRAQAEAARRDARDAEDRLSQHVALVALVKRIARLNPAAGEIGAGMLASLVEEARRIVGRE